MKKFLVGLTFIISASAFATAPCKIYVSGIVGKTEVKLDQYNSSSLSDYIFVGKVTEDIRVGISESADAPDYTIEIYDRRQGVRVSSDRFLRYETGANGSVEKIVVNAYCI